MGFALPNRPSSGTRTARPPAVGVSASETVPRVLEAEAAVAHNRFVAPFSLNRMTWIKPQGNLARK